MTFSQLKKLMAWSTEGSACIEMHFCVRGRSQFHSCYLGKDAEDAYWLGLTQDGKNAYEFGSLSAMMGANVFDGRTLSEIWQDVIVLEIDGCDPSLRLPHYIGDMA